ncbi:hepatic leukemia factor-like [Haliotis asinina]|uniref:hepatic leukemia factor-like n=1 Tax=Haliotis asinina TaxID=109174 RepID=UPI0035322E88
MADGSFCDFPQPLDTSMISSLQAYHQRTSSSEDFDAPHGGKSGPGFYSEYGHHGGMEMAAAAMAMGLQSMTQTSSSQDFSSLNALATTAMSCASGNMFDQMAMNYPLKPEKNMPPTPPGSPDDPKELQGIPGLSNSDHMAMPQNMMAKPVPMKKASDRRHAQARPGLASPTMVSPSMMSPETIMDPSVALMQMSTDTASSPALARALSAIQSTQKRPRSEKKAIPDDQKDNKYFERRQRNNNAAKKSRDARKAREDEIAIRASFLEKENAILRAQVATLREEANSLRQLLLQKRSRH